MWQWDWQCGKGNPMVSKDINLIAFEKKLSQAELVARKRLKNTVLATLFIYTLLSASILGYFFYLRQKLATIEAQINNEQARVKIMARNEGAYMILKQKSTALSKIMPLKVDYVSLLSFLKSQESDLVSFSDMTFTEAGQVSFQVSLKDTPALDAFLNTLTAEKDKLFRRVELSGVDFKADGTFQITFTLQANS